MTSIPATQAKENFYQVIDDVYNTNCPVSITDENGRTFILIREDDFNSRDETAYLHSIPGLAESIIEAASAPDEEFVDESEVVW